MMDTVFILTSDYSRTDCSFIFFCNFERRSFPMIAEPPEDFWS